jgi:predicted transposase YbfD/YdcC
MQPTPKKTLEQVLESGNDYLVALKPNQPSLYRQVKSIAQHCKALFPPLESDTQQRGRHEKRTLNVFDAASLDAQQWPQVRSILSVHRQTTRKGKTSAHTAYYISSVATSAHTWMRLVRGHWSVENRLHWVKDVVLGEDNAYGINSNALLNASVFRSITINLLRLNGFDSIKPALRLLANQVHQIFQLLQ